MSYWVIPMVAANTAVPPPIYATTSMISGAILNKGLQRTTIKTPAVTMVAAWIKALTGVGPSIASGSQVYNGIWADLPVAPINSNKQIMLTVSPEKISFSGAA